MTTIRSIGALAAAAGLAIAVIFGMAQRNKAWHAPAKTYEVHGRVLGLDQQHRIVRIAHEEIPGFMPAMAMDIPVKNHRLFDGLSAGKEVDFQLSVTTEDSWISKINVLPGEQFENGEPSSAARAVEAAAALAGSELNPGEMVPDFQLTDQSGKVFRLKELRGQAVVLTFIYTRCPLPNFCALLSKNFAALQQRLTREFPGRYKLLSISMDPRFDTPEVLKDYAGRYGADEKGWLFATGDAEQINQAAGSFGLVHDFEGGLISHNLRTALVSPQGRLVHLWKNNQWTPYEVQRKVREILSGGQAITWNH